MASKIPCFSSSLKAPTTTSQLAKRKGPEVVVVEKRTRVENPTSMFIRSLYLSIKTLVWHLCCYLGVGAGKLMRSKSVSNITAGLTTRTQQPGLSRATSTVQKPAVASTLNRAGMFVCTNESFVCPFNCWVWLSANRTTACANITRRMDAISNTAKSVKGEVG